MTRCAALLIDLQHDFIGGAGARLPVDAAGAEQVVRCANAILAGSALAGALPILVVNRFPRTARIANRLRHGAAIEGSAGAELDRRIVGTAGVAVIAKTQASAFTNPRLQELLAAAGADELYALGVHAEGCVRATVLDALRRGYAVKVVAGAVASGRPWKKRFALWSMRRAGATILPDLVAGAA